jgi:hypothetical protein
MTPYLPTLYITAAAIILLILWDIAVVWTKGGTGTISWLTLTLWLSHPIFLASFWILAGHLFFPRCGNPGQPVSPRVGTVLGFAVIGVIIWEVVARIQTLTVPKLTAGYFARLAVIAVIGLAIGHYVFGQYVKCG